ncbi:MAG: 30S ribosome-binding factor RbfA [Bacteroidetes bacterium]|nr:30S ribosome-binding factor RbfA [Bacteroidota bacterium]
MGIEETPRQQKIATAIQQELAKMLQEVIRNQGVSNLVLSVTKVKVTIDLSMAKIYLSIFPKDKAMDYLKGIQENKPQIRHDMAKRMKNQLRRMPEFSFFMDDSLDYVDAIEKALNQPENPFEDPKGLPKRQKK